jgi:hydroxypyruvate isomerase
MFAEVGMEAAFVHLLAAIAAVAGHPSRSEPGTGEINYAGVARALKRMRYAGPVGM